MYYQLNGKDYYWDGKYWREKEGKKASDEIAQQLGGRYPEAQGEFPGDEGDRIFVLEERLYRYDQEKDEFRDPLRSGMTLPRRVEDALRIMLNETKKEITKLDNLGAIREAAKEAKVSREFSRVVKLCELAFGKTGKVDPMFAAMYCSALRELNRYKDAIRFARRHRHKKWTYLLSSLTAVLIDVSKTREDIEEAEETLELYKKSGGAQGTTIKMLRRGLDKRWREIKG